jgi:hypothetical protein
MAETETRDLGLLGKLVIAIAIVLFAAGVLWHGLTLATLQRLWSNLADRPSGPMSFRFILQPAMAAIAATKDGLEDARTGRSPYFWTVLSKPDERVARLREGLDATARVMLLGLAMDAIYQLVVLEAFYPVEAPIVALLLAFVPYFLLRGPIARIARRMRKDPSARHV